MSVSSNQKKSRTSKKSTAGTSSSKKTNTKRMSAAEKKRLEEEFKIRQEIMFLIFLAFSILLTLCTIRITGADGTKKSIIGSFGDVLSSFEFGLFGFMAYAAPLLIFLGIVFSVINQGLIEAKFKLGASIGLFLIFDVFAAFIGGIDKCGTTVAQYYEFSKTGTGGGIVGALLGQALHNIFGMVGTIAILIILMIICFVLLTEKSFLNGVKRGSRRVYETAKDDAARRREINERRREEQRLRRLEFEEAELNDGELNEPLRRMERKVSGVSLDVTIPREAEPVENIHELTPQQINKAEESKPTVVVEKTATQKTPVIQKAVEDKEAPFQSDKEEDPLAHIQIKGLSQAQNETPVKSEPQIRPSVVRTEPVSIREESVFTKPGEVSAKPAYPSAPMQDIREIRPAGEAHTEVRTAETSQMPRQEAAKPEKVTVTQEDLDISEDIKMQQEQVAPKKEYILPPIDLLQKSENKSGVDSAKQLKETALHLQETLRTFGVNVTITDISQGPAVTRYELQPEQGVKVSKIVNLADDIKLNLAATDIRIEAPIPGKAAIGIEVPNKENTMVAFRDLIETKNYEEFPSKLSFAVGKDIAGQTVVTDIAKMPHLLIAGSTGSGKSVCINTLIMSILYKAHPDEVKLIMIDPKVVELSVYNGIPHLMIPVVTDPKKAAGALAWGVAEMTERYKKFADFNVRDLKGYNQKVEAMETNDGAPLPEKLPQVVIIVDELADLMMVAPGEVEESICRLAQLARAAGIHLVIATQRPSVDVITGLIKANMPSRIAFAVSSGVDSRTILDMNGAEKLLGKGDMLFYPQGLSKPSRVQGAFVSDKEVSEVVEFLKNQCGETTYASEVEQKISAGVTAAGAGVFGSDGGSDRDVYFYDAGTFIIEKDKASIGMLQRVFKIGFNRAARIMDQLAQAGVVGEEEGTKPRKVLMTQEQFEQFIEEGA